MSSSRELYTRVIHTLSPLVSVAHIAHLANWVWIVVGIVQANSIALSRIAVHIPGETQAESRVTTIRRWLKNFRVDVWELYRPVLEHALQGWQTVTAIVIVDGVTPHLPVGAGVVFGDRWQIFRLSLAHGGRAIPLVWLVLPGKGLTQVEKLEPMLRRAATFLNGRVQRVIFLANAGFRDCDWAQLCLKIGWQYAIRIACNTYVTLNNGWYGSISALGVKPGQRRYYQQVWLTQDRKLHTNLTVTWTPGDEKHPPEVLALISDQPAARARLREYAVRMHTEIVFPQMTKTDLLAGLAGGDHITDLDLVVGNDYPIDEQFHQLALLFEVGLGQAGLDPAAKRFDRGHQAGQLGLAVDLRLQLPGLGVERLILLLQVAPPAFILGQRDDAVQVGFTETLQLRLQLDPALAQSLAAGLQFLRQPVPPMRALQRMGNQLRMRQDFAHILPDQIIQLAGRDQARRTALVAAGLPGRRLAATDVVAILNSATSCTRQVAHPATDQRPQEIVVRRVIAAGKLLVMGQLGLHLIVARLADDRWNGGHRDPRFGGRGGSAIGRPTNRMGGRSAQPGRPQLRPAEIDLPGVGRIHQNATHGRLIPAPQAARRGQSQGLQMPGQARQAGAFGQVPGKHLLDHCRFRFIPLNAGRVARAVRIDSIAIGHVCPGQQGPGLQLALPAAAHAFRNERPLVFGHCPTDLQQ